MDGPRNTANGRIAAFEKLLSLVHEITDDAPSEVAMLQAVCEAAAESPLGLVWCGVPGPDLRVEIRAAAGRVAYLENIVVSVDPVVPEGRGLSGKAWRDGTVQYAPLIGESRDMQPWQSLAARHGLTGVVVVRLQRQGVPWGLFSFYLLDEVEFEPEVRLALEQFVRTVSRGLDRLDSRARVQALTDAQRALLEHAQSGIALLDGRGRVLFANPYLAKALGYPQAPMIAGMPFTRFVADAAERTRLRRIVRGLNGRTVERSGVALTGLDGASLVSDMALSAAHDGTAPVIVWTVRDVSERVRLEDTLAGRAYRDPVTGLANRWAFDVELAHRLEDERRQTRLALCLFDLDDFKRVNDSWGHGTGDAVLRELADRLSDVQGFAARLGGDELVVLVEMTGNSEATEALEHWIDRLHRRLSKPYGAIPGGGTLDVTMGIAVYPEDGATAPELLRNADQALYELKRHKHDRLRWWQRAGTAGALVASDETRPVDAYGPEARALLSAAREVVTRATETWGDTFYAMLEDDPRDVRVLHTLPASQRESLKAERSALARVILQPDATREGLRQSIWAFGEQLMLVGSPLAWRSRAVGAYQELIADAIDARWMNPRDRYRLRQICDARCGDVLTVLLESGESTMSDYLEFIGRSVPERGLGWLEASRLELEQLHRLPGIAGVFVWRADESGTITTESSVGAGGRWASSASALRMARRMLDGRLSQGELVYEADVRRAPDYASGGGTVPDLEFGSLLAVPILDEANHCAAVLGIVGRYPHQFQAPWIHQFNEALKVRWAEMWGRFSASGAAVSERTGREYRTRLWDGGLSMYVQPVVNLATGRLVSVEALARLVMPDGTVLPPSVFLPLLTVEDLSRLFHLGLDQALAHRAAWAHDGVDIGVAVNMPPSLLLDPQLPQRIADALDRYGTSPDRLTLELLETEPMDQTVADEVMATLMSLGVNMAVDDLGSGYSSLMRLAALPLSTIKIDQSLMRRVYIDPLRTLAVVDSLVQLARRLDRDVVAEGLETPGMIEEARLLGVSWGQGYALARPMPANALRVWVSESASMEPATARVKTVLGAVTYDWKIGHSGPESACGMTEFLRHAAADFPAVQEWHRVAHDGPNAETACQSLSDWLRRSLVRESMAQ